MTKDSNVKKRMLFGIKLIIALAGLLMVVIGIFNKNGLDLFLINIGLLLTIFPLLFDSVFKRSKDI